MSNFREVLKLQPKKLALDPHLAMSRWQIQVSHHHSLCNDNDHDDDGDDDGDDEGDDDDDDDADHDGGADGDGDSDGNGDIDVDEDAVDYFC